MSTLMANYEEENNSSMCKPLFCTCIVLMVHSAQPKIGETSIKNQNEGGYRNGKTSGTSGCIPHPYIFVQLLQDSEA